jgi:hypothetical protein
VVEPGASVSVRDPMEGDASRGPGAPAGERLAAIDMDAFCRVPARYIHIERFLACVPSFPAALAARVLSCARLHRDLSERIVARYRLDCCTTADFTDRRSHIALLDIEQVRRVGELAGGIWHAQTLRSMVLVHALGRLLAEFGPRFHEIALANLDLSPKAERPLDSAALADAIRSDGMHCLNAAIWQLSTPLRSRILLRFPIDSPLGSPISSRHQQLGPLIVDRVIAAVMLP